MNQVNITGMIANEPIFREETGGIPHTILSLQHRHKTHAGELRKETYRVSAWHGVARWARDNVAVGQIVTVHGYLTQRKTKDGAIVTEICADEIVPSVRTTFTLDRTIDNDAVDKGNAAQAISSVAADNAPVADTLVAYTNESTEPVPGDTSEMPALSSDGNVPAT